MSYNWECVWQFLKIQLLPALYSSSFVVFFYYLVGRGGVCAVPSVLDHEEEGRSLGMARWEWEGAGTLGAFWSLQTSPELPTSGLHSQEKINSSFVYC